MIWVFCPCQWWVSKKSLDGVGEWGELYLVLVRYSIYRSIAILVYVRYRYLVVSRYFNISNIEWINDQSDDTWAIYKYRVSNEISSIVWYDSWSLKPGLYFECKSTLYTVIRRWWVWWGARRTWTGCEEWRGNQDNGLCNCIPDETHEHVLQEREPSSDV